MLTVTSGSITAGGQTGATVTLSGTASAINTALSAATYTGNLNFHGADTLSATTTDGGGQTSGLKQFAITVADTGGITENLTGTLSGNENSSLSLAGLTVADSNPGDTLTTVLTVTSGSITAGGQTGATVTLSGTASAINTALSAATYTGNLNFHGADTLSATTTDGGGQTSGLKQFAITVADTGGITENLTGTLSGNENSSLSLAGLTVADSNPGDTLTTVLTVTSGSITAGGQTGATVTLSGTASAINTALSAATYTGNLNFHGADTLSATTTDGGGQTSGLKQFAITVADTGGITENLTGTLSGNENSSLSLAGLTVADSNPGDTLTTVLTVTSGSITAGGQTGATVTLSGTASAINTALSAATYTGNLNFHGADTLSATTTDGTVALGISETPVNPNDTVTVGISGIPSDATLSDSNGDTLTVVGGNITLTAAELAGLTLHAGDTNAVLTVTASNAAGGTSAPQTIGLTVTSAAPTLTIANHTLTANEDGTVALGISETPVNPNDTVTVGISGIPSDATLSDSNGDTLTVVGGNITLTAAELAGLTLHAGDTNAVLTVTASNAAGGTSAPQTIDFTTNPVAPILSVPNTLSITAESSVGLGITETPINPNDTVSITISGIPSDATLSDANHDTLTIAGGNIALTPAELAGLTLNVGQTTTGTLVVTATNTLGATASVTDDITLTAGPAVSVSTAIVDSLPVQVGQTLVAEATILNDSADSGTTVTYQWQSSSDGGVNWTNANGSFVANYNGGLASFLQLTAAQQGEQFRVEASFADSASQVISGTSAPTVAVSPITPVITAPFSVGVEELSIVKNGSEIYDDTFGQAPPESPILSSSAGPTPVTFFTLGSTWTDNGGKAIMSSTGVAANSVTVGVYDDIALLNTNTDPASSGGLKEAAAFTVSATLDLVAGLSGNYGIELNDASSTNTPDQDVRLIVQGVSGGGAAIELVQSDPGAGTTTVLASQTLTSAQLTDNNEVQLQIAHAANTTAVTGSFTLLENGTTTGTTVTFTPTGTIFTTEGFTRVDIGTFVNSGVEVNFGAGQSVSEGQILTASASTNDPNASAINYQWEKSGSSSFSSITDVGTDSASYTVQVSDVGQFIRVVASTNDASNPASATSAVTGAVVDTAVITENLTGTLSGTENSSLSLAGLTVADSNSGDTLTTTLTVTSGSITAGGQTGATVTLSGTASAINTALSAATYTGNLNFHGADTLSATTTDGGGASSGLKQFAITVADTGGITENLTGTLSGNENSSISLAGLVVADSNSGDTLTTTLTVTSGSITAGGQTGSTVTLSGTASSINTALSAATYTGNLNFHGADTLSATTTDGGGASSGLKQFAITVADDATLSVSTSVVGSTGSVVQVGNTLVTSAVITGDSSDLTAPVTYQWQISTDGVHWNNVSASTTGLANGVLSSFYQVSQADLGDQVRVQASFTDDTGQTVTATSTSTSAVAEITPILTAPFSYAVDEFKVSDGLGQSFDDTFSNGAPPIGGSFGSNLVAFQTSSGGTPNGGSTWTVGINSAGQPAAIMSSSGTAYNGTDDSVQAILLTSNQPESVSNSGLKEDDTFTASGTFDLVVPQFDTSYGIELDEVLPVPGTTTQQVQIQVFGTANGGAQVHLGERDPATGVFTLLASYTLTGAQLNGNNKIELDLVHGTVNSTAISGSFELIDNGTLTFSNTFSQTGTTFADSTAVRALIQGISTDGVLITGTAQQGQTLTANTVTNDPNATITYQWMENSGQGGTYQNIGGATGATYVAQQSDVGFNIEVVAAASDLFSGQSVTATSVATSPVAIPSTSQNDEWINTAGGTWSDVPNAAANWSDGAVPRSIDNVVIDEAGIYTVTVPVGVTANAASLTLNDAGATLDVHGTLTIAGALTIDVGKFVVDVGNDITVGTTVTNAGALELATSAELPSISDSGGTIDVDSGNTLTLAGSTITGGTINNGTPITGATISIVGSSAIENASLDNGAVTIASGQTLTLDGTTLAGATITSLSTTSTTGTVNVDAGKTLTLAGTDTLTGGVLAFSLGPVQAAAGNSVLFSLVEANDLTPGANPSVTLTIQASSGSFAAISGSGVAITQNGDVVTIVGGLTDVDNALDNGITYTPVGSSNSLTLSVTDGSGDTAFRTISINTSNPASPTTTNLGANGEITNAGLMDITGTATLSSDSLFNNGGTVKVESSELLKLDDVKVYGGTVTDNGTVEFTGFNAITSGANLNIGAGDQLTIDPTATLMINGATVTGGTGATINNGTSGSGGIIGVQTSSTLSGVTIDDGAVSIAAGVALTLDGTTLAGATITSLSTTSTTGTVNVDAGKTLTLAGTDTLTGGVLAFSLGPVQAAAGNSVLFSLVEANDLTPGANPSVTLTIQASSGSFAAISGSGVAITQNGDVVTIVGGLTDVDNALDNGITYTPVGSSNSLTLSVTDGSGDSAFRAISINTSNPALPTSTNLGANGEITNAGLMDITGTATLSSDSLFNNGGTVKVENGQLLKLDDTRIYGGTITDNGTIEVAGFSAIVIAAGSINLNIGADDQLTIDPTSTLAMTSATVTGGTGATINDGTGNSGASIEVESSTKISGVTIDNGGVTIASGQTLTLDNDTLNNVGITDNGSVHVDSGDLLTISGVALTGGVIGNSGTLNVIGPSTLTNTTLNGGQVTIDVTLPNLTATDQGTVVQFTGSGFDATRVFSPAVAEVNGQYIMLFGGQGSGNTQIGLATSSDGAHWSISPSSPVIGNNPSWASSSEVPVSLTYDNGTYELFFNGNGTNFGEATSSDGINWTVASTPIRSGGYTLDAVVNLGNGNGEPQYLAYYVDNGTLFSANSFDGVNFSNDTPVNAPAGYSILATAVTTINGQGALVAAFQDSSGHGFYGITTDGTDFTIEGSVTLPVGMTINSLIIEDGLIKFYGGISENGGANTDIEFATAPVPDVQGLTLSGATISGSAVSGGGIDVTGSSAIGGNASITGAQITVESQQILSFGNATLVDSGVVNDGTIAINPATSAQTLTLNSVGLDGGTVTVGSLGTITTTVQDLTHNDNSIDDATIENAGTIEASSANLHLDDDTINNAEGTLAAIGAQSNLTLDNTTVVGGTLQSDPGIVNNEMDGITIQADANGANTAIFDGSASAVTIDAQVIVFAGAQLELIGTVDVEGLGGQLGVGGAASLNDLSDPLNFLTAAIAVDGTVTLDGGNNPNNTVTLNSTQVSSQSQLDEIIAAPGGGTLDNYTVIQGSGAIGPGGGSLTLINEAGGFIEAAVNTDTLGTTTGLLTIDTGNPFDNAGTLESGVGATLTIDDSLSNTSLINTNGGAIILAGAVTGNGSTTIQGGTLEVGSTDAEAVSFNGSGTLQIDNGASLSGVVNGFAPGDTIDAKFGASTGGDQFQVSAVYNGNTDTTLTVTDLTQSGHPTASVTLAGDYSTATLAAENLAWSAVNDGGAGVTLTEQPDLVVNGGFEDTGNFITGWITGGDQNSVTVSPGESHSGDFSLLIDSSSDFTLDQNISTATGATYQVQFWLSTLNGGTPNDFSASFGGTSSISLTNTTNTTFTEYTFDVTATDVSTDLHFAGADPSDYLDLDDISVTAVTGVPVITVPGAQTITAGTTTAISGISLAETSAPGGDFTVTLADTSGDLSATGDGTITGAGTTSLTITGSFNDVNDDLTTLTDTGSTAGSDTILVNASDGIGVDSLQQAITVDVAASGPTTNTWAGTGDWTDGAHWSAGSPPSQGDAAAIASGQAQVNSDLTLDANTIQNSAEIDVGATASADLTLTDGTSIVGGTLNIDPFGEVYAQHDTGSAFGAALDGVTVTMFGDGELEVGTFVASGPTLILEDGTKINGGTLTLDDTSDSILVQAGSTPQPTEATLDHVDVNSSGTVEIATGATLLLDDGTTISGGTLVLDDSTSTLHIEPGSSSTDVTLDNVAVTNAGNIQVDPGVADLILTGGTTISGGTLTIGLDAGEVDISGAATFDNLNVSNESLLQLDTGATLSIAGTLGLGGNIGGGEVLMENGSKIVETSADKVSDTVANLSNGDVIEGAGQVGDGTGLLALSNSQGGNIDATISGQTLILDTGDAITNIGALAAISGATLLIDDPVSNEFNGNISAGNNSGSIGTVEIENTVTNTVTNGFMPTVNAYAGSTVELNGGIISAGTVTTATASAPLAAGAIFAESNGAIDNATITNHGELETGGAFTLDDDTVNGGVLTGTGAGSSYDVGSGNTLTLNGVTVVASGGASAALDNAGTVTIETGLTLSPTPGAGNTLFTLALNGAGTVSSGVGTGGATITANGAGEVLENNGNLFEANGTIGNNNNDLTFDNTSGTAEALNGALTIHTGNQINNAGTLEALETTSGTILTLDDNVSNTGTIEAAGGGKVVIANGVANSGTLNVADNSSSIEIGSAGGSVSGAITVDSGVSLTATGTFIGTVNGIVDKGTIAVAAGGTLTLQSSNSGALFQGSGTVDIGSGSDLIINAGIAGVNLSGPTIAFAGTGESVLTLDSAAITAARSSNDSPTVTGLNGNDAFFIQGTVTNATYSSTTGVLTVAVGGNNSAINIGTGYGSDTFFTQAVTIGSTAYTEVGINETGLTGGSPGTSTDNYLWVGPLNGSWGDTANWKDTTTGLTPTSNPGAGTNVTFGASSALLSAGLAPTLVLLGSEFNLGSVTIVQSTELEGGGFISTNTLTVAAGQTVGVRGSSEIAVLGTANDATFGAGSFLTVADSSSSVIFGSNAGNTGGAITVVTGASVTASSTFTAPNGIINNGTITASTGGTLVMNGAVSGDGTFTIDHGATLKFENSVASGATITFADSTATLDLIGSVSGVSVDPSITNGGTINITSLVELQGGAGITGGALSIASGATLDADTSSGTDTLSGVTVSNSGILQADPAGGTDTLALSGGTVVTGGTIKEAGTSGILEITGGATLNDVGVIGAISITVDPLVKLVVENGTSISGTSAIANGGTIEDSGGLFTVGSNAAFSGSGNVEIAGGGTADFLGSFNQAVSFAGNGVLELSHTYSGTVTGFGASNALDEIDLSNVSYTSNDTVIWTSGTLTVSNGTTTENFSLSGSYSTSNFALEKDSSGDSLIAYVGTTVPILSGATYTSTSNGSATASDSVTFEASTGTFALVNAGTYSSTVSGFGAADVIDLIGATYANETAVWTQTVTGSNAAGTLQIYSNGTLQATLNLVGTYSEDNFVLKSDGAGGADVAWSPSLWNSVVDPADPTSGEHLYGAFTSTPNGASNGEFVGVVYGVTAAPSVYSDAGPDNVTDYLLGLDPFLSPYASGITANGATGQQIPNSSETVVDFPHSSRQLLLASTSAANTEGIGFFVTENGNTAAINQFTFNEPTTGLNNALTITTGLTPVVSGLIATNLEYFTNLENSSTGLFTGSGAAYSLAYGQYNTSTETYTVNYDIFSPVGATTDASNPDLALDSSAQIVDVTGITGIAAAPAWFFRSAGSTVLSGVNTAIFGSVIAENNGTTSPTIQFQTFKEATTSTTGLPSFAIHPVLTAYAAGATDAITVESAPTSSHTVSPNSLTFTPNSGSGTGWSFAWDDTVTDTNGTHNQVEFALYNASGTLVSQSEFQVADGNVQNVELDTTTINGAAAEILIYSDDTGTNVVAFNSGGTEIGSLFNAATTEVDHVALFGDGRIALTYDNVLGDGITTQFTTDIYDLRTSGMSVNDTGTTLTSDQYYAGTQYGDTIVVGASNVNSAYYYVGDDTAGTGPTDNFTGATGANSWNVAILPDAPSNYTITTFGGVTTLVNTGDAEHAGTLNLTDVQALAFDPTVDPSGNSGTLTATGDALYILGPLSGGGEPIAIDTGTALVLATADSGTVTFAGTSGEAVFTSPASFTGAVAGLIQGDTNQILDLGGLSSHNGDTLTVMATQNGGDTTLLVTDTSPGNGSSESILLVGNETTGNGYNWTATADGNGGANVVDPAPIATIANGASLDIAAPSNENVTFTGGIGSLILNDPAGFTGQIVGFTGTAPDAAHSDTVDLVGIDFNSAHFADTYSSSVGLLTVTDGTHTADITFDDFNATLDFASDGNGGTLITDPPSSNSSGNAAGAPADAGMKFGNDSIDLGGSGPANQSGDSDGAKPSLVLQHNGNDTFVFNHELGAETGANAQADAYELGDHADVQLAQQLASLITPDPHAQAVFEHIHNDIVAPSEPTPAQILHLTQTAHLLH